MQERKWAKPVPSHRDQTNKSGLRAAGRQRRGRRGVHRRPGHQSQRHLMCDAHKCATVPVWAAAEVMKAGFQNRGSAVATVASVASDWNPDLC